MAFLDYFSQHAGLYAAFRPRYPLPLFEFLARNVNERGIAWDCATGNGQAAEGLSHFFKIVIGTDASREQLQHAFNTKGLSYCVALADRPPLRDESADVVTVAQALHWFDTRAFFQQVRRVLKKGGVISVWSYNLLEIESRIDALVTDFYWNVVGPYWAPERRLVEEGYRSIPFPFEEFPVAGFAMQAEWTLSDLIGYIRTWSATQKYLKTIGKDPLEKLAVEIHEFWADPEERKIVRWPLSIRAGRKTTPL